MLCRLCLYDCELDNAFLLFKLNGDETDITKLIAKYIRIEIKFNDTLSSVICPTCSKHLVEFDKFLEKIEQRQNELEFMEVKCVLQDQEVNTAEIQLQLEHNEESLLDIKDVLVDNEMHVEFGEAFDAENESDGNDFNGHENDEDDDDVPLNKLATKSTPRKVIIKNSKPKGKVTKRRKKKTLKKSMKTKSAKENINANESQAKHLTRDSINYKDVNKERDDLIANHMKMKCELCDFDDLKTFKDLRTHFRLTHKQRAFLVCCSQRFFKRFQLIDHIQVHLNPNYFQCKLCGKVLSSRTCMDVHNANTHADKSALKYPCTMCERRFAHTANLQAHLLSHSEERTFTCDTCNKAFKTAYMLKMHKQKMHEIRRNFICDICGKEYRFKPSFLRHVAEHEHGVTGPTEECPICGKLLMPNGLRRHLDRHNIQENECTICGKKLKSKAALKGHIDYAHKKTRSYNCTFCDKSFKRPCVLKEHIAMHTGQKLYNCPNCPREFRSKANMYSHNKKVHRAEWEQAQKLLTATGQQQKITKTLEENANRIEIVANMPC